jgi:hypothetical protein
MADISSEDLIFSFAIKKILAIAGKIVSFFCVEDIKSSDEILTISTEDRGSMTTFY